MWEGGDTELFSGIVMAKAARFVLVPTNGSIGHFVVDTLLLGRAGLTTSIGTVAQPSIGVEKMQASALIKLPRTGRERRRVSRWVLLGC